MEEKPIGAPSSRPEDSMAWDMGRQLYVWESPETGDLFVWHEQSQSWIPDKGADLEELDKAFELENELALVHIILVNLLLTVFRKVKQEE